MAVADEFHASFHEARIAVTISHVNCNVSKNVRCLTTEREPYPHRRRFELKIFADGNSLAHALTYLQDPLR